MKQRILRPEHIPLMLLAALFCLSFFFVPGFNQSWLFSTVLKNGSVAIPSSNTAVPVQITGLTVGGSYYLSAVLVDARGERSPVKVISFTTPDNTKPASLRLPHD